MATANPGPSTNGLKNDPDEIRNVLTWFKENNFQRDLAKASNGTVIESYISEMKTGKKRKVRVGLFKLLNDPTVVYINKAKKIARLVEQPEEKKREVKVVHPIFIVAEKEVDLSLVLKFADQFSTEKKLFVLPPIPDISTLSEERIKFQDRSEKLKFLSSMSDSEKTHFIAQVRDRNKLIEFFKPKCWTLTLDRRIECRLIMVNAGSSKEPNTLKQKLGKLVEDFAIKSFEDIIPKWSPPVKAPKVTPTPYQQGRKTYESEKVIGREMMRILAEKLKTRNAVLDEEALFKKFTDFKFLILLPNIISITKQTKARLEALKTEYHDFFFGDPDEQIIRIDPRIKEMKSTWDKFIKSAKANKKILHLIIHDECHWAAGKGQVSVL